MGGVDGGGVSTSTASDVRVGLTVHSGQQAAVGSARLSVSDTTTAPGHIRFATTATEVVCTLACCTHCCACHLRHNKSGSGRCMRTARQPYSDCACADQRPAGCCGKLECAASVPVLSTPLAYREHSPQADSGSSAHLSSLTHPLLRHRPLVCVERLAAPMSARKYVLVKWLLRIPKSLGSTHRPLVLQHTYLRSP